MLKKSLLTAVILGAMVAAAGAQCEEKIENAKRFQNPQPELVLNACETNATPAQASAALASLVEQQNSAQLEELGSSPSFSTARYRRYCFYVSYFGGICF